MTFPSRHDWQSAGALLLLLGIVALPAGFATGFLRLDSPPTWKVALVVVASSLFLPALLEELLFRVLLLPHPSEEAPPRNRWLWGALGLALFVASHLLNAAHSHPDARATFTHPGFLLLATALGLSCTLAYLRSGSVWPPVAIHWIAVITWLLFLGGYERLHPE